MTLFDQLRREEGLTLTATPDSRGFVIGYGHNTPTPLPDITLAQAEDLLSRDVARVRTALAEQIPWYLLLSEPRRAVLEGMAFQMGVTGLLSFHHTLLLCQTGNYLGAASGMRASVWHEQTPARCERQARQMETDVWT